MNFSVLMSVYYKESSNNLDQALESVIINQALKPTELVLIADGPLTDSLYDVIRKYKSIEPNFIFVQLPENRGLGYALNEGMRYCSCEWIARMDSDDISMSNRFEIQMQYIQQHPEVDVVGAWIVEFEGKVTNVLSEKRVPENHDVILSYAKYRCPINHPVVVFRKTAILAVGGYKHWPNFEDYWLWVRLLMNGAVFYNIQKPLLWFRSNDEMFKRRGGLNYVRHEWCFQRYLLEIKFISRMQFVENMLIRSFFRLIPNNIRAFLYKKVLRTEYDK